MTSTAFMRAEMTMFPKNGAKSMSPDSRTPAVRNAVMIATSGIVIIACKRGNRRKVRT